MKVHFTQFVDKEVIVNLKDSSGVISGILREISDYGILVETTNTPGLYFYSWFNLKDVDLSQSYGRMGRVA